MKRCIVACCALAFCGFGLAYAKLPPPSEEERAKAAAAKVKATEEARKQAEALAKAQDRVVEFYKRSKSGATVASGATGAKKRQIPKKKRGAVERLACLSGNEDRHARIGVELIDGKVNYFAYYSKWKPRTCSIEVRRGGPYSRWEDRGATSKVTLGEEKGVFLIDRNGKNYRFVFRDVDRGRYCGMDGKINGSLTVVRGKSKCQVQGVMDGHAG